MKCGKSCLLNIAKHRHSSSLKCGFTIVELLVVIVVIGILAAITIVSYTGISQKATVASLTSDLTNASKQLKLFQVENSNYPTTIDCTIPDSTTNKCIKTSTSTTYTYKTSPTNSSIFCIEAIKSNQSYNITQENQLLAGPCPVLNLDAGNTLSYPGTGTTWKDLSGNDNNGTLINGVAYSSVNGGVMSFDGVDDYVNGVTQPAIQIGPNNFTIAGFIYPDNQESFIITPQSNGLDQSIKFDSTNQRIIVNVAEASNTNQRWRFSPSGSVPLNTWTYWAISINDKNIKIYINGLLVLESNESISIADWSTNWVIGQRGISTYWYKGSMGELRVYNRELTATEIIQNFNATKARYGL